MNHWYKVMRDMREDRDLNQTVIANYLNITQKAYSQYDLDQRSVPIEIIIKIADFYNVTTDYILGVPKRVGTSKTEET